MNTEKNGVRPVMSLAAPPSLNDTRYVDSLPRYAVTDAAVSAWLSTTTGYGAGAAHVKETAKKAIVMWVRFFMGRRRSRSHKPDHDRMMWAPGLMVVMVLAPIVPQYKTGIMVMRITRVPPAGSTIGNVEASV